MKFFSETHALEKLHRLKTDYAAQIINGYEHKAKSCLTCETQGACCLDAHFVNVHITRLEAAAIQKTLAKLPERHQGQVYRRIDETIKKYALSAEGDTSARTFACPLFEKGTGCLVHAVGKPLPCIQHACYENERDLPPDELLSEQERRVENLNKRTYGNEVEWLPLPVAICQNNPR